MKRGFVAIACFMVGIGMFPIVDAAEKKNEQPENRIEIYYPHNTFRCLSCNTIENLTRAAIFGGSAENKKYKTSIEVKSKYKQLVENSIIVFKSVNVDEAVNRGFLKDFKAKIKFPVMVHIKDGKIIKTEILGEVWNLMDDNEKFIDYIQARLDLFLKKAGIKTE